MRLIERGTFQMGAVPDDDRSGNRPGHDELPRHQVTLTHSYYIDEREVTVGQWRSFAEATHRAMPGLLEGATDDLPVHNVHWAQCVEFTTWAGVTLPSEAQWERAARGGRDRERYPWGDEDDVRKRNGLGDEDGFRRLAPVGSYPANAYGLFDMCGNAAEYCSDVYSFGYYERAPSVDPRCDGKGTEHVARGGGGSGEPHHLRTSARWAIEANGMDWSLGFRCVKEVP